MNKDEIRKILSVYRPGGQDASDPVIASAKANLEKDLELAQWFAEEQEFDRKFAKAITGIPIPTGFRTRLMAPRGLVASGGRRRRSSC
jgi:hypothetical protein